MAEGIDSESDRLKQHRRVQVPLPEEHEQQDVVQVSNPEVVLVVPSGKHHACQPGDDADQFQPAHPRPTHRESYVIDVKYIHKFIKQKKID